MTTPEKVKQIGEDIRNKKKSETMVSIIRTLRNKNAAYPIEAIMAQVPNSEDVVFELLGMGVINESSRIIDANTVDTLYSLSIFYGQRLRAAPQTESVIETIATLFPNAEVKVVQSELF